MSAAAMADGRSHLYGGLTAQDPAAMAGALRAFGLAVSIDSEPWTIDGQGGWLDAPDSPIDAHESGLTARIVLAMAASLDGRTIVTGTGRLPERPMSGLLESLRSQGVEIRGDRLPIEVMGRGRLWGGSIGVDCSATSQHATALMLVAPTMREPCTLEIKGLTGSGGYLDVTAATMRRFGALVDRTITGYEIDNRGYRPADVVIEADASASVYPLAIAAMNAGRVVIEGIGGESIQPDLRIAAVLESMGCTVERGESTTTLDARDTVLRGVDADMSDAPDGSLALAIVCLFADDVSRLTGLGSLRHKESDRLEALSVEIERLGGRADTTGDSITIHPSNLHGGVVDPHGDHRIAMSMGCLGTRVPGVLVANPSVVDKTWPEFWEFLASLDG
jgi:3-phosphoshikimate 1-carboxyvinyltransferase